MDRVGIGVVLRSIPKWLPRSCVFWLLHFDTQAYRTFGRDLNQLERLALMSALRETVLLDRTPPKDKPNAPFDA